MRCGGDLARSGALVVSRVPAVVVEPGRVRVAAGRLVWTSARTSVSWMSPSRSKEVVLVSVALEPDRDTPGDETQAFEEIRELFARYRQIARYAVVVEHAEPADARAEEANGVPVPTDP
jgi:hypothetical protein